MAARVEITPEALDQAQELNEPIYSRVMRIVERLANWRPTSVERGRYDTALQAGIGSGQVIIASSFALMGR